MTHELLKVIQSRVCYTDLVYQRVNKKLNRDMTPAQIEALVQRVLNNELTSILCQGKNYYIEDKIEDVVLTINRNNYRLIYDKQITKDDEMNQIDAVILDIKKMFAKQPNTIYEVRVVDQIYSKKVNIFFEYGRLQELTEHCKLLKNLSW